MQMGQPLAGLISLSFLDQVVYTFILATLARI